MEKRENIREKNSPMTNQIIAADTRHTIRKMMRRHFQRHDG